MCNPFSWAGNGCLAQAAASVPGGDSLNNALTSVVRFGDEVTFGASHWVRHEVGLGNAIDECSSAYNSHIAVAASTVFMIGDGEGEAAGAAKLSRWFKIKVRPNPGADGGISRMMIEKIGDETVSTTHQVQVGDEVVHQHQIYNGKYGGERVFPPEWHEFTDVG